MKHHMLLDELRTLERHLNGVNDNDGARLVAEAIDIIGSLGNARHAWEPHRDEIELITNASLVVGGLGVTVQRPNLVAMAGDLIDLAAELTKVTEANGAPSA